CRCVCRIRGRRNSVRYRTVVAPPGPYVTNTCAAALRGTCGNSVTRTGRPGECLCRTVSPAVNAERATYGICLDSHLDGRCRCRSWCWRRTGHARVNRVNKGLARIVVTGGSGRDEIGGRAVRGEAGARVHEVGEAVGAQGGVKDRRVFHGQHDAPELAAVLGALRDDEAGMVERVRTAHNQLRGERINDLARHIVWERDVPALGAVRVQCEQLDHILDEIMDAVTANVGLCENIVRVRRSEAPQQGNIRRVCRDRVMDRTVRGNGWLRSGTQVIYVTVDCKYGRAIQPQTSQMVIGVEIQLLLAAVRTEHNLGVIHD